MIQNYPPTITLLHVRHCKRGHFRPPQPAAQQQGDDGAGPSAWRYPACSAAPGPVFCDSHLPIRTPMDLALFTRWMPAASSGSSLAPLSVASTASVRIADISHDDRRRPELAFFQRHAPGAHGGLREAGPRLGVVPGEKFIEGHVVDPLRNRGTDGIEHERLQSLPLPPSCLLSLTLSFRTSYWAMSYMNTLP
jgi:hypothetical protein